MWTISVFSILCLRLVTPLQNSTNSPTTLPSPAPSPLPTTKPTPITWPPTPNPTTLPTPSPSPRPTASHEPSHKPTPGPTTSLPSATPTTPPTPGPTTALPSSLPTTPPTSRPTPSPTRADIVFHINMVVTAHPNPTMYPTRVPTILPTALPSLLPSSLPSTLPTTSPSASPTSMPTPPPTGLPTTAPSPIPTTTPSSEPTATPTNQPSASPSSLPSALPSVEPSDTPTSLPTVTPTEFTAMPTMPTMLPTPAPTLIPSAFNATAAPSHVTTTVLPTRLPTTPVSDMPTTAPSVLPSRWPTATPSTSPSISPTQPPTLFPTNMLSVTPTLPTVMPTPAPTSLPSQKPTATPSLVPSSLPSSIPSAIPFGVAYCRDFDLFGMTDYYSPVMANLTNATSASTLCDDNTPNFNATAMLVTRANYFASDMIRRNQGEDILATAARVNDVVYTAAVETSRLSKKVKQRVRVRAGGSSSRRLATISGYTYNASSALQFVDAAAIVNVSTNVMGTIGPTGVPTSAPTFLPTALPTPSPTELPTAIPTATPTTVPTFVPTAAPTPACPSWATTKDCDSNCLCCTSYNVTKGPNGTISNDARQANTGQAHRCLMCYNGYDCFDADGDGDGECIANTTGFLAGNNLCDWWLWAWYYGAPVPGRDSPNGHAYAQDFSLEKPFYIIGGLNCSADRVDIISADAPGRTFEENGKEIYHACVGLFAKGNDTRYPSGSSEHEHDREGSICYKDYRDPDYRGYCAYEVGPSACARCNPYSFDDLIVAGTLSLSVSSGQTAKQLNSDTDFKLAMRTAIFFASGLDTYTTLTNDPYTYVRDLEFVDVADDAQRRRRLLATVSTVDALYNLVVAAASISDSASDFYTSVANLAETSVNSGSFTTLLTSYLSVYNVTTVNVNVTAIYSEVTQTVPPTYWSFTAEAQLPAVIQNRLGGFATLPACGCAD